MLQEKPAETKETVVVVVVVIVEQKIMVVVVANTTKTTRRPEYQTAKNQEQWTMDSCAPKNEKTERASLKSRHQNWS
jgi:hypothetical protein